MRGQKSKKKMYEEMIKLVEEETKATLDRLS